MLYFALEGGFFMLEKLSGPIIGAIIGYCTNYIAVKMLFYPRKEIRVFGRVLPFTPGAIPKGKPRLAKAVGNVVANTLLTEEDIKEKVFSTELQEAAVDKVMELLSTELETLAVKVCTSEEKYESVKEKLTDAATGQIMAAIEHIGVGNIIATEGKRIVKDKVGGSMIGMFLSDDLLGSIIQPMGQEMEKYIAEHGEEYIRPEILSVIDSLEGQSAKELCLKADLSEEKLRQMVTDFYHYGVDTIFNKVVKNFNIAGIIEEKINHMSVEELEKLVFAVMKKELDVIVNLGALIGALLGIFNMIF